ncbi:hypothetical protein KII97_01860 [Leuconostoc gelidum subsp. gasicomitatum]|uniref:hypothetical protein n=1 Tax=Leuconostoc gasicomitatum TaxID=115778 RepID=UPI001CC35567|nr:hypothetical protein [Leuconostoc gasicomitatum]MBZ5995252.1 hypothetical protein [Leuconostoc gasicomitatum]
MKKGIKKAITSPTKETVITDHKRSYHGFCYTHFTMKDKKIKSFSLTLEDIEDINSMFDEPLFVIDDDKLLFRPVDEGRFRHWLNDLKQGDNQ